MWAKNLTLAFCLLFPPPDFLPKSPRLMLPNLPRVGLLSAERSTFFGFWSLTSCLVVEQEGLLLLLPNLEAASTFAWTAGTLGSNGGDGVSAPFLPSTPASLEAAAAGFWSAFVAEAVGFFELYMMWCARVMFLGFRLLGSTEITEGLGGSIDLAPCKDCIRWWSRATIFLLFACGKASWAKCSRDICKLSWSWVCMSIKNQLAI